MTENTEQVTNNNTEQRGFIGDPLTAFVLATQPGPGVNIFQGAYGFTVQDSTINAMCRDQVTNVQNINNYYQGTPDSDIVLLRERLNPILNPARKIDYCLVGTAGTGKSAIAVSLAQKYREMQPKITLAVTYHCVRGQDTSNVLKIVPTLCYFLALSSPAYKAALAEKFQGDPSLSADLPLFMQFQQFFWPFQSLLHEGPAQIKPIIIIDGLDEMGNPAEWHAFLNQFEILFNKFPWFKLVITSRPQVELEISENWKKSNQLQRIDLNTQNDIHSDIQAFFDHHFARISFTQIAADDIEKLVVKADGLFVWATTALKFLEQGVDKDYNFKLLLDQDSSELSQYASLFALYKTVLEEHFSDTNALMHFKAIMLTLMTVLEPITPQMLVTLMSNRLESAVPPGVTSQIVDWLKAVVYEKDGRLYYHLSFQEFLSFEESKYQVQPHNEHLNLANGCLRILDGELKFNICDLESLFLNNYQVTNPSIQNRVDTYLSQALQYSCLH
ncbi:hypothetical protein D9758_003586 [Tetrapyrgos nigripes]|uniref:Nephrocystin 3-like N-terminal domain-containing protein n=1 Tax=Tetrapyrgos nigripes TaxID=182062 RepID=A0A8H5LVP8_9AGAR|nr:hypothetical protein D9758_003586 [Tetrapyrgos nigripes]